MEEPGPSRLGRLAALATRLPSERDWERSSVLEPRLASRDPELISDGGGLPFALAALSTPPEQLDPRDPAVAALIVQLTPREPATRTSRKPWKRAPEAEPPPAPSLAAWRQLARTDGEAVFGRGRPPELLTVAVARESRRPTWTCISVNAAQPLRAAREGVRASSWRTDPSHPPKTGDTELRVLVKEQTYSGAQRADGRVQAPDLYVGEVELVLRMFVTPRPGFQARAPNPETPVRIALPHPIGPRRLIDGALYGTADAAVSP
jgi:hypothetical protein